jgi:hypothetical protein
MKNNHFLSMLHTPLPNEDQSRLETLSTPQLLGFFSSCLKRCGPIPDPARIAIAWGIVFSRYYLTATDLVDGMQQEGHPPGSRDERMLREFIAADCRTGGHFVLNVIKKGGMIDRAALILIADPDDLALIEYEGTTAIHLLAAASDKGVRPVFIRRAGSRLLRVYDNRGIPAIYTVFGLGDLTLEDLNALAEVFSEKDLQETRCKNGAGKDALTVFDEVLRSLRSHAPMDRHMFFRPLPPRDTGDGDQT